MDKKVKLHWGSILSKEGIGNNLGYWTHATTLKRYLELNQELFLKYFSDKKIIVIPHGVERDFRYRERYYPKNIPFQYLYVGAPNPRKGYEYLMMAWNE